MTNEFIIATALKQSAEDMSCQPEDFLKTEPVIVTSHKNADARRYLKLPFFCNLVSYGSNIVVSCSPAIADRIGDYIRRPDIEHCFESRDIFALNREFAKFGQVITHMAEFFLPDTDALREAAAKNICPLPTKILTKTDFAELYLPEWSNALAKWRPELDVMGVSAYDGDRLVGLAACSADGDTMWQIGIDVLPAYRKKGIAKALVTELASEIISRGVVPFYCAAWANIKSVRCAIASGFRPAWAEMTAKPAD